MKAPAPKRAAYCKRPTDCEAPKRGPCRVCQQKKTFVGKGWVKTRANTVPVWIDEDFDEMGA
jgi:hypothetical protein